jgi:predicted O-methyltransferase YrrM
MQIAPSIYSLSLDHLAEYDFSRPLFVQASRQPHFDEVVDLMVHRLGLEAQCVTLSTGREYRPRPWMPYERVVRATPRLSAEIAAALVRDSPAGPFSVAVLTTSAPLRDSFLAVRHHSNVVAFGHALEPLPVIVVNATGHTAAFRTFFRVEERTIGPSRLTGNFLMAQDETDALYEAALARPDGHVVEVGRFSGGSALVLATAGRVSGRPGVHSVDIEALEVAEYFFAINGLSNDILCLAGDSTAVAGQWRERDDPWIGLLFIDADHEYESVARDLQYWTPFLVPGGTLVLHDMHMSDAGVDRAIYYQLLNNPAFGHFRHVGMMLLCERISGTGVGREFSTCAGGTIGHAARERDSA